MNLVIDIGNTRTKFGVFNHNELIISVPVDEFLPEHVTILKNEHPSLNKVIVSSVKQYPQELKNTLKNEFDLFIELTSHTSIPVSNLYKSKSTLGNDRIAAIVGASHLFPNSNVLVIDSGTAITYDILTEENEYLGGNISPGIEMRFKALQSFTGKLPLVCLKEEEKVLFGNTTESAIRSGVQNGIVYEVETTINKFIEIYKNLKIILTGGNANFFDKMLKNSFFVNFNLIAIGLNKILEHNAENN